MLSPFTWTNLTLPKPPKTIEGRVKPPKEKTSEKSKELAKEFAKEKSKEKVKEKTAVKLQKITRPSQELQPEKS